MSIAVGRERSTRPDPSCWDLNGNGLCDLSTEDKDGNGVCNAADCQGSPGATGVQGPQGTSGQNGTSCSVVDNGNGTKTIVCQDGTQATVGDGANGTNGTNGANGTACWDLNSNGKCDLPGEDKRSEERRVGKECRSR